MTEPQEIDTRCPKIYVGMHTNNHVRITYRCKLDADHEGECEIAFPVNMTFEKAWEWGL